MSQIRLFLAEVKRRKVWKVAGAYAVVGAVLAGAANDVLPRLDLPDWTITLVVVLILLGFPIAIMLAWAYELRPETGSLQLGPGTALTAEHAALLSSRDAEQPAERAQSIAVLPFVNMSSDSDNEYFAEGISEELINALTQFSNLRVIARTSSFAFKGKDVDVRDIGRMLGVGHVLEGSVRRAGTTLRITAQLIDTSDGSHTWSARYDRTPADTFAVQDEITAAVRDEVGGRILGARSAPMGIETDQETYDLFLRGRALLFQSSTRFAEAYGLLTQAAHRDPEFVPVLIALADAYSFQAWFAATPARPAWQRVRTLADHIAARDTGSPTVDRLRGTLLAFADRDFENAEIHLRRTVERNPSDGLSHGVLALVLVTNGRSVEADHHNRRLMALDPLSPVSYVFAANNWAVAGQFAEAEAAASAAVDLDPRYPEGYHMRGYVRNYSGRFREAEEDLARVPDLGNRSGWPLAKRATALVGLGRHDDARRILEEMLARRMTEFMTPDAIACVHQLLGHNDEAFEWLSRAAEEQAVWTGFVGIEPMFAPLRRDIRFEPFCQRNRIPVRPLPSSALDSVAVR